VLKSGCISGLLIGDRTGDLFGDFTGDFITKFGTFSNFCGFLGDTLQRKCLMFDVLQSKIKDSIAKQTPQDFKY